ncbi:MAG: hypothetical protein HUJ76_01785 [Parasporobacterium sp.]|nr:hypothetical protein [Parasporobacterium sp.]
MGAEYILEQLASVYYDYAIGKNSDPSIGKGFARMFRHWVSYNNQKVDEEDKKFLSDVERLVAELVSELSERAENDPDSAGRLSSKAVDMLLFPGQNAGREKQWFMLVAAYQCESLFQFMSGDDLRTVCDRMLKRTPRRMMLPKELELLESAEKILNSK